MNFGEKLKDLMKGQHLSQKQLADRLGVSKSIVSYYESGDRYPSYDVLVKIAHVFHVTTDFLLDVDRKKVIDVSNLTDSQISILTSIAEEFTNSNNR